MKLLPCVLLDQLSCFPFFSLQNLVVGNQFCLESFHLLKISPHSNAFFLPECFETKLNLNLREKFFKQGLTTTSSKMNSFRDTWKDLAEVKIPVAINNNYSWLFQGQQFADIS